MNRYTNTARTVGVLYIIGTVAGILSATLLPVFGSTDLLGLADASTRVLTGALLVVLMAVALAMIPVVLYPVLRQFSERLAVGYLVFRGALETTMTIAWVAIIYALLTVSRESVGAGASEAAQLAVLGTVLDAARHAFGTMFTPIVFTLGAIMFYYVLYRASLVPRWLSGFGLVAAVLYLGVSVAGMLGLIDSESTLHIAFALPIAVQEMVLAVWLIVKGFDASAFESTSTAESATTVPGLDDVGAETGARN